MHEMLAAHPERVKAFAGIEECLAFALKTDPALCPAAYSAGGCWGSSSEMGTKTFEEAVSLARAGDRARVKDFERVLKLSRRPCRSSVQHVIRADVSGPFMDPGLVFTGVPEAFVMPLEERQNVDDFTSVEIVVNRAASAGVSADTINAFGVLALAVATLCDVAGFPTRILWAEASTIGREILSDATMVLKDWSDPLDIPVAAFWLANPAALRRISFAIDAGCYPGAEGVGYGKPCNSKQEGTARAKQIVMNHGLIRDAWMSPEAVVEDAYALMVREGILDEENATWR